jgi:hypothetical protein
MPNRTDYTVTSPNEPDFPVVTPRALPGWPARLCVGLSLITLSWSASWSGETPLAHHSFFPLWLGYVLSVDAATERIAGSSLWTRGRARFAALFVASIPFWWLFEAFNDRLHNWSYQTHRSYSWLEYHLEASLAFSTVLPAMFVTAELYAALLRARRWNRGPALRPGSTGWAAVSMAGLAMIALTLAWPDTFFPLVWIGVFAFVDPLVRLSGGWNITAQVERGWWGTIWRLFAAGVTCGFFWEMWNSRALPKWTYSIEYADHWRLFEMPLLGYGGYLPFALECYALAMLVNRFTGVWPRGYLRFSEPSRENARSTPRRIESPSNPNL